MKGVAAMTHVLVVHHDPDMADQQADWLRAAGFTVSECAGPQHGTCPILHHLPCPAVEGADVMVYDVWASGDTESERELIERLREVHPEIPIVLTAPGMEFDWVETKGDHGVVTLEGAMSAALLRGSVNQALESVGRTAD
jgi:DNA-binding NtrC family response regulator